MQNPNCRSCAKLLQQLREVDFCLVETALYLDAYPDHPKAMEYYRRLVAQRAELAAQYEAECGPLTVFGNRSAVSWDWTKAPWPWEAEAN